MEKLEIGTILKPQALKGELKVSPNVSDPNVFKSIKKIFVGVSEEPSEVQKVAVRGGYVYLMLDSCQTINEAEVLRNVKLYALKEDIVFNKENEFLICDLIGMQIVDEQGKKLGDLEDIEQFGGPDILCIRGDGRIWRVPFISEVAISISLETRQIVFNKKRYWEVRVCD
ncbi:MAG: ribosome maturation factor RimM [Clostridia bacterium]